MWDMGDGSLLRLVRERRRKILIRRLWLRWGEYAEM